MPNNARFLVSAIAGACMLGIATGFTAQPRVPEATWPSRGDEHVAPLPGWSHARTGYGAVGDGVTDDTDALQSALDELGTPGHSPVLYLPTGTYRITRGLRLDYDLNLSIVGEDPDRTTIVWDGAPGGTMLAVNGIAYSRFTRLTFDGRGAAAIAIDQSWDRGRPHFDTGNEYSDLVLTDVDYGIRGGFAGHGFAETSVVRSRFIRNRRAGIALGNFNALDLWVWNSLFEDCGIGVTNADSDGAGNFHVYNSVFRRSKETDLSIENTGGFAARGNYSVGSRAFFTSERTMNHPATIRLQRNVIVDPLDATPIRFGNQGPGILLDNIVASRREANGPAVEWSNFFGADVISIGNTFTVSPPLRVSGRLTSLGDQTVDRDSLDLSEPELPDVPPQLPREVFTVPPASDGRVIQEVVNRAAERIGHRPVVYLQHGTYLVDETVVLPPGDLQIVGDGYGTVLRWTGAAGGPVLRVRGPSRTTLRELQVDGAGRADGILIDGVDQAGARVYMHQVELRSGVETLLLVDRLDHALVQLENFGFAYSPGGSAIRVIGGPAAAAGRPASGRVNVLSGAASGHRVSFEVSDGAKVLARDLWYESGAGPGFARVERATLTVDGVRVSSPPGDPPAIDVGEGARVTVMSSHLDDRIALRRGARRSAVLAVGTFCERPARMCMPQVASGDNRVSIVHSRQIASIPLTRSTNTPDTSPDDAFLLDMLAHARQEGQEPLDERPAGSSDVRLFRVWVTAGVVNVANRP
jgi:hypothetical protein